ncbi:hypothetical protein [Mesorhizobium sp. LjRoot246]|uniref:hypothetical protein n=1 Tax=Mesorhizobium sp. LjRoot246 TaxID=3342294 RepID=UPI003ECE7E76
MALSAIPATSAARRNFEIIVVITRSPVFLNRAFSQPDRTNSGRIAGACRLTFFLFLFQPTVKQSTLGALHKL